MKASFAMRLGMAFAGVLLAGAAAGAQAPGGGPGMGGGGGFGAHRPPMERAFGRQGDAGKWWNNPRIVEKLKLTDDQRKTMDGILLEHREKLIDLRATVQKAELELEPLMKDDQPNEAKILSGIDKVAQARAELEKANARFLLALRSKLTPEQWKMVQGMRNHRGEEDRMGHDGQRGQGRSGWNQGGPDGPGAQFRRRQPPPPAGAAPGTTGPQSMDVGPDAAGGSPAGADQ